MRVNVDSGVFTDARFKLVARRLGMPWHEVIGKCVHIWMSCYEKRKGTLRKVEGDCLVDHEGFIEALCIDGLAIDNGDEAIINGFKSRASWLNKASENGKKGGVKSGESRRNKAEGHPSGSVKATLHLPRRVANPLTHALTLTHAHDQEEEREKSGDAALALARCAVAEINRLTGKKYGAESQSVLDLARALAKAKRTEAEVVAVIRDKHAEWGADPKASQWICPPTLLGAKNFARYLDELNARGGQPREAAPPPRAPFGPAPIDYAAIGTPGTRAL